eukprot:3064981-Rhodomonas_salina.1
MVHGARLLTIDRANKCRTPPIVLARCHHTQATAVSAPFVAGTQPAVSCSSLISQSARHRPWRSPRCAAAGPESGCVSPRCMVNEADEDKISAVLQVSAYAPATCFPALAYHPGVPACAMTSTDRMVYLPLRMLCGVSSTNTA